jgi:cysteine desulfurase family protein (TIGR01976 family)
VNRERFPALADGWARLDGPAGTIMVDSAVEALRDAAASGLANHGGLFEAAERTDAVVDAAREACGRLLGAPANEIAFGPSTTAMIMRFNAAARPSRVLCTRLDHDANVAPWLLHAGEVVFVDPTPGTLELPVSAFEQALADARDVEWVAVTAASNAVGTVPDLKAIAEVVHAAGAKLFVDAVHAAPHRPLDVAAIGCDALACSAYKWFGPHIGVLWARAEILEALDVAKLRPSSDAVPDRWELGTLPFESLAAVTAAAEYVMSCAWEEVRSHEDALLRLALDGLGAIDGVTLYGGATDRTPTLMFNVAGRSSEETARALAAEQIAVWHGNYYAWELECHLGLAPHGAVRAGFVHYNERADAERLIAAVASLAGA